MLNRQESYAFFLKYTYVKIKSLAVKTTRHRKMLQNILIRQLCFYAVITPPLWEGWEWLLNRETCTATASAGRIWVVKSKAS